MYKRLYKGIYESASGNIICRTMIDGKRKSKHFDCVDEALIYQKEMVSAQKRRCILCNKPIRSGIACNKCNYSNRDILPVKFSTYTKQLPFENISKNKYGFCEVECHNSKCTNRFTASRIQITGRIDCSKHTGRGDSNWYCSDNCKITCGTYNKHYYQSDYPNSSVNTRCNQQTNKKALLGHQQDKYGYTFCEICSKKVKPELHHGLTVAEHPNEADNIAHQLLCCNDCHKTFKNKGGC